MRPSRKSWSIGLAGLVVGIGIGFAGARLNYVGAVGPSPINRPFFWGGDSFKSSSVHLLYSGGTSITAGQDQIGAAHGDSDLSYEFPGGRIVVSCDNAGPAADKARLSGNYNDKLSSPITFQRGDDKEHPISLDAAREGSEWVFGAAAARRLVDFMAASPFPARVFVLNGSENVYLLPSYAMQTPEGTATAGTSVPQAPSEPWTVMAALCRPKG